MKDVEKYCPFCFKTFSKETLPKHIGIIHLDLKIQQFSKSQSEEKKNPGEAFIKQDNPPDLKKTNTKEKELKIALKRLSTRDIARLTKKSHFKPNDPLPRKSKNYNKKGVFKCDHCNKSYTYKHHLREHCKTVHEGLVYKCDLCDKVLNSHGGLSAHKKAHHSNESTMTFRCDFCSYSTPIKGNLQNHLKRKDHQPHFKKGAS